MAFGAFATGAPVVEQAPRRRSRVALYLLLPGILFLALFFIAPLVSLVMTSLQAPAEFGDIGQYETAFRWENYWTVLTTYGEHTVRSRAFDTDGNPQPPPADPYLAARRTYWENNGQITRRVLIT